MRWTSQTIASSSRIAPHPTSRASRPFEARDLALRQPNEQFVLIGVADHERRVTPIQHRRLDALLVDVSTKRLDLLGVNRDEYAAVARAAFRPRLYLVQDQLKTKQADLKYERLTLLLVIPVQRETQRVAVKT